MAESSPAEAVRNLRIRQTWLQEQTHQVCQQFAYENDDDAFQAVTMSLLFNLDYDAIQPEEIVNGGRDKQIDIIRIDDDQDRGDANIYIVQAKNTKSFSSNVLIRMRNGLSWIFERPAAEYRRLKNAAFINKIDEIRQMRIDYGAANLNVHVYYSTLGDTRELSDEYIEERKIVVDTYSNVGFNSFVFRDVGAFELVELLSEAERLERQIDVDIPILYDVNRPSVIQYNSGDTKALICTVKGAVLASVASAEPRDAIFDLNVRPYYGSRGQVNSEILTTCTSTESARFWFLNNGVTMVCDRFDLIADPDNPMVKVSDAQIVNGCQTTVTLREALESKSLKDDVSILLKLYATDNPHLAERITLTTNNQNRITDRDLRANDDVQIDIQRMMKERYGFYYERKNKQHRNLRGEQRNLIVPNYKAAQAYLAIIRRKPSIARGYLLRIWSDYYKEIFENATVEDLLASYLIYRYCVKQSRARYKSLFTIDNEIAVYGAFHIARICGSFLTKDNWGGKNRESIVNLIKKLSNETRLAEVYLKAHRLLVEIRLKGQEDNPSPALYYKAGDVQKEIERTLAKLERSSSGQRITRKKTTQK